MCNLDDKEEGEIFNKLMVNLYSSINIMRISNYFPHEFIINSFDFSIISIYPNLSLMNYHFQIRTINRLSTCQGR